MSERQEKWTCCVRGTEIWLRGCVPSDICGGQAMTPEKGTELANVQGSAKVSPSGPWYSEEQPAVYWQQDQLSATEHRASFFFACSAQSVPFSSLRRSR